MTNSKSFTNIADAISSTNDALTAHDSLAERCETTQGTVAALTEEVAALHRNDAKLDAKARAAKFGFANGALSLAQGDLRSAQDSLAAQKALTVATGKAAASRLFEVRDLLRMQRVANVSARLSAEFDWTAILVRVQDVANAHKSVRAIEGLGVSNLRFQLQHDDSFTIGAVRHLGEHWAELKPLVEAEGVELNISAVAVPAIPKPKPTLAATYLER